MAQNLYQTSVGPKAKKPQFEERIRTRQDSDQFKARCEELANSVQAGDPDGVVKLLDYFSGKAQYWSPFNMIGLAFQGVEHPVTVSEISRYKHTLKPGAKLAELMVPIVLSEQKTEVVGTEPVRDDAEKTEDTKSSPSEQKEGSKLAPLSEERRSEVQRWIAEMDGRLAGLKAIFNLENPVQPSQAQEQGDEDQREEAYLQWVAQRYRSQIDQTIQLKDGRKTSQKVGFKLVKCVADLGRDTQGEPLLSQGAEAAQANPKKVFAIIRKYAENLGIEVKEGGTGMANGTAYVSGGKKFIAIKPALDDSKKVGTLIHEIAHHLLDLKGGEVSNRDSKPLRELRAEAVSYVVSKELRVPNKYSTAYLLNWGVTAQEIQSNLLTIAATSKEISLGVVATQKKIVQEILAARNAAAQTNPEPIPEKATQFEPAGILVTTEGPIPVSGGFRDAQAIFTAEDGREFRGQLTDDNIFVCEEGEVILNVDITDRIIP